MKAALAMLLQAHLRGHICDTPMHAYVSGTMLRQSQGPRRVPREHAECFLSIVRHTICEQL